MAGALGGAGNGTPWSDGGYALTENIADSSPKLQGVLDFLGDPPPAPNVGTTLDGSPVTIDANEALGGNYGRNDGQGPGSSYVSAGSIADFLVNVTTAGTYQIKLNYSQTGPDKQVKIFIDGQEVTTWTLPYFDDTAEHSTSFAFLAPGGADDALSTGLHSIRIESVDAAFFLDSLTIDPA